MIVCKYKFDSSIYNNLIPEFNSGYNGYSINDTIDGNIVTRTIECDTLPTLMRFGQAWVNGEVQQDYTRCLLEILDMNTSELTNCSSMFRYCINLTNIWGLVKNHLNSLSFVFYDTANTSLYNAVNFRQLSFGSGAQIIFLLKNKNVFPALLLTGLENYTNESIGYARENGKIGFVEESEETT